MLLVRVALYSKFFRKAVSYSQNNSMKCVLILDFQAMMSDLGFQKLSVVT